MCDKWAINNKREKAGSFSSVQSLHSFWAKVIVLVGALILPTVSSGEQWHDFTHVRSVQVTYLSALLEYPHLSAVQLCAAPLKKNTAQTKEKALCWKCWKRSIKSSPSGWQQETVTQCSRERYKMCCQSVNNSERLNMRDRGKECEREVRKRRNRQLVPRRLS